MEFMVAVFRARTQTLTFANLLKSYRIRCSVINTPRIINVSCGISVKFFPEDLNTVESILARRRFDSYGGIYRLKQVGNNIVFAGR